MKISREEFKEICPSMKVTETTVHLCNECRSELLIACGNKSYRQGEEINIERGRTYFYYCPNCDGKEK